jgi:DNA-binding NtrC family response regulator
MHSVGKGDTIRTLVVCTEASELLQMLGTLNDAGYRTMGVSAFEDARRQLRIHRFDLVVTSLRLQNYNGLSLALFARLFGSAAPTVVIDACPDRHNAREAERLGATYVGGPPTAEELLDRVQQALHRGAASAQA